MLELTGEVPVVANFPGGSPMKMVLKHYKCSTKYGAFIVRLLHIVGETVQLHVM